jgi:tetratricopeptide (TPR) repeat protein
VQQISYLWGFSGEVSNVTASAPESLEEPFRFSYDYTRKDYVDWENHRIVAPLPVFGIEQGKADEKAPSEPLLLGSPGELVFRAKVELPPKFEMQVPAKVDLTQDFAEYHSTYSFSDGVFMSERRFIIKKPELPLAAWDPYLKFRKSVVDDHGRWITLTGDETKEAKAGSNSDALYDQAYAAGKAGDHRTALNLYKEVVKLDPKFPGVWNNLGREQIRLGLAAEAVGSLKKALENDPQDDLAYRNLARAYLALANDEQALEACRTQIHMRPNDDFCSMIIGHILVGQKKYAEAVPALQLAIRIKPDDPFLHVMLGAARLNLGDSETAMADFKRALQMGRIPTIWMRVSSALSEHKVHLDEALKYANSAAEVTAGLLEAMIQQKQYAEASKLSEELVSCWDVIAYAQLQRGELIAAEKYASAAWKTKLSPRFAMGLGRIYESMGDRKRSQEVYAETVIYFFAEPSETQSTLQKIPPEQRAKAEAALSAMLSRPRSDVLPLSTDAREDAEDDVWLVLGSSGQVADLQFVEHTHSLDQFLDKIRGAHFDAGFPDGKTTAIVRRGRISCSSKGTRCAFKLLPELNESVSGSEQALFLSQH